MTTRDICGMTLDDLAGGNAKSPGKSMAGRWITYGLENHCGGNVTVGSNPTPSAPTSQNRF